MLLKFKKIKIATSIANLRGLAISESHFIKIFDSNRLVLQHIKTCHRIVAH